MTSSFCWRRILRGPHVVPKMSLSPTAPTPACATSVSWAERENSTLKRLLVDAELEKAALKEIAK